MNMDQFIEALEQTKDVGEWFLDDEDLRCHIKGWFGCPLTVVCLRRTGVQFTDLQSYEAGDEMGMDREDAVQITGAADVGEKSAMGDTALLALRSRMLEAVGVEEGG